MWEAMSDRVVAVIDLKAFYAVVECVERKLDPFTTPLIVADKSRGTGTIVLSVSPFLKARGVPSRCRVFELPKDDAIIFARPRMSLYLQKSAEVVSIMLDFVGEDDLHVYSIDEAFLNLGPYLQLYKATPKELVQRIIKAINKKLGLFATAGIGSNNFIAKSALDLEAKKRADGIAVWTHEDIKTKLWPLAPLSSMWGISSRLEARLNNLGIETIGDLAQYPKNALTTSLGVMGEQLWNHANGIDESDIRRKYVPAEPSLSMGQVLFRDYDSDEIPLVIREMCDDMGMRLRLEGKMSGLVSLFVGYSDPGGFSRQMALMHPTDDTDTLYHALIRIYERHIERKRSVRNVGFAFAKLTMPEHEQLDLFIDPEEQERNRRLQHAIDAIKYRYGRNAVLRSTSLLGASTTIARHHLIGGHLK